MTRSFCDYNNLSVKQLYHQEILQLFTNTALSVASKREYIKTTYLQTS